LLTAKRLYYYAIVALGVITFFLIINKITLVLLSSLDYLRTKREEEEKELKLSII